MVTGHFAYWTLCLLVILRKDFSCMEEFVYGIFNLLDSLPVVWTFRLQGSSPLIAKVIASVKVASWCQERHSYSVQTLRTQDSSSCGHFGTKEDTLAPATRQQ